MGKNTSIEWTDHTFNPWWGCVKVSPGCQNCYAETLSNRYNPGIWGPAKTTDRRLFGDKHWNEPLKWDRDAAKEGVRKKVFCASMADVFEGHPQTLRSLARLLQTIVDTPHLIWLLLTKRPENIMELLGGSLRCQDKAYADIETPGQWLQRMGDRVWMGTSVEDQARADLRVAELLEVPAKVHFLSVEPLLGPVNLADVAWTEHIRLNALTGQALLQTSDNVPRYIKGLDWVIVGGESGPGARPMAEEWALSLRDQCIISNVAFFSKQMGSVWAKQHKAQDKKGGDWLEWSEELRIREFPRVRQVA